MARFTIPDGWTVQAFQFALDCTAEQEACLRRQFGGRRYARNWAVRVLKEDITRHRETGEETEAPSLAGLRKRWNQVKDTECVDAGTGEVWWPQISKEAFGDGIKAAVDAYWNWQSSRAGTRQGRRVGFPRFAKKGRDRDRVTFTTGAIRVEPDRRHVTLPRIGTVRVHENTRRLQRLISKCRARILAATVSRRGTRLVAAFRVLVQRPIQPRVTMPGSRVGVDVGMRVLATVANFDRQVIERVPNPRPLESSPETVAAPVTGTVPPHTGLPPLPADTTEDHPAATPGRGHPQPPHSCTHHEARQDPRRDRGRRLGRGRDAAAEGPGGRPRPQAWPVRLRPRRDPPPAGLQNRLVRIQSRCGGPLVPLLQDLPCLRACAGDRMGRTLDLHPLRDQPPARRQRRHQPRALRRAPPG